MNRIEFSYMLANSINIYYKSLLNIYLVLDIQILITEELNNYLNE
jgi:hypothetical protein